MAHTLKPHQLKRLKDQIRAEKNTANLIVIMELFIAEYLNREQEHTLKGGEYDKRENRRN